MEFKIYLNILNLIFNISGKILVVNNQAVLEDVTKSMSHTSLSQANYPSLSGVLCLKWSLSQNHLLTEVFPWKARCSSANAFMMTCKFVKYWNPLYEDVTDVIHLPPLPLLSFKSTERKSEKPEFSFDLWKR